jgi:ABC-type glycerol-3-phosphate transport system substrate-binding protein
MPGIEGTVFVKRSSGCIHTPAATRRARGILLPLLTIVTLFVLTACNDLSMVPFIEEPATATVEFGETAEPVSETVTQATEPASRQLVVWLPEFAGYGDEGNVGDVLYSAFRNFEQQHPEVRVEVQEKASAGPSDIMTYLRTAQRVAPDVLPDVVLMDSQRLWELADLGLLPPMEAPPMERSSDFYQFALDSTEYGGAWYGTPYAADVIHTAGFLTSEQSAPRTWNDLLENGEPHLYAAGGADAFENGAVLLQYVGAGGQLLENGSTSNEEALTALFDFLVSGSEAGVVPAAVMELTTLDSVWNALTAQGWGSGDVSSSRYLVDRESLPGVGYAPVATRNGLPITLGTTWSLVALSEDEEQRALAFDLINQLLDPTIQGPWSHYVHRLPTQRSALEAWPTQGNYTDFLNRQLEVAVALPNGRAFADFAQRLLSAQLAVLRGESTPEDAVAAVRGPG